jgi:hypothetical protein
MKNLSITLRVVVCAVFVLCLSSFARAQATRTWVSGVGNDADPCSRTAPCKTFAGAMSKTFIAGEIDALDPGGFGTVTITKSITIDGGSAFASILASGTNGVNVSIAASANDPQRRVVLRRLSINGTGASGGTIGTSTGIRGVSATNFTSLQIENCYIQNFTTVGVDVNVSSGNPIVSIKDTNVSNTVTGVQLNTAAGGVLTAVLERTRVDICNTGINVKDRSFATIRDSVVQGNGGGTGVQVSAPSNSAGVNLENTVIFNSSTGFAAGTAGTRADLSDTSILNNTTGVSSGGATVNSHGNNRFASNSSDGVALNGIGQK